MHVIKKISELSALYEEQSPTPTPLLLPTLTTGAPFQCGTTSDLDWYSVLTFL